jgi:hypothetical protein
LVTAGISPRDKVVVKKNIRFLFAYQSRQPTAFSKSAAASNDAVPSRFPDAMIELG